MVSTVARLLRPDEGTCRAAGVVALAVGAALVAGASVLSAEVVVSEVLASNRFSSFDDDGESSDWVELFNAGGSAVELQGYALSDDPTRLQKWVFPDVEIPAGGYLVVWASGKDRFVPPPETISSAAASGLFEPRHVRHQATWRFLVADPSVSGPPSDWTRPDFDDASWLLGPSGFGYGDGDDATPLAEGTTAVFTRRLFQVPNPAALSNLVLEVDYDDGFVAYINGVRVASAFAPGDDPDFGSVATGKHEAGVPEIFDVSAAIGGLIAGTNVLAVVGLNDTPSSDMSLRVALGVVPLVLHTSFRLEKAGETITLLDASGSLIDGLTYPEQTADHSWGLSGGRFRYLLTPTPGEPNETVAFDEPISDSVEVAPPPGRYQERVDVELRTSLPDRTVIRFTTDGSEPTASSPSYVRAYPVTENTVLRAAGFIGGERSTRVTSASYFIDSTVQLPILSISMDPAEYAAIHNNANGRGRTWERPAVMEYFDESGERVVSTGLGIRLHGGAGRGGDFNTKKAYKVYFRRIYGEGKLRYPIIPETPVAEFDKLVLRSGFNDSFRTNGRATYLRDELVRDLHEDMGALAAHGSWCMLYVNMRLRGLYNIVERMDEEFLSSYLGGEDWDVIKTGNDVLVGTRDEWDRLHDFAVQNDLSQSALYEQFLEMIDIENYTSYMILNMWAQNHDWPHNNWYAARERVPGAKWLFLSWDAEFGIGLIPSGYGADSLEFAVGREGYLRDILVALLENPSYRELFMREVDRYAHTVLDRGNVRDRINRLRLIVEPDIPEEVALFGQSTDRWLANVGEMMTFGDFRSSTFTDLVARSALYDFPEITAPIVSAIRPEAVVNTGDTRVYVVGDRFTLSTRIFFDSLPAARVEHISRTSVRATLPFDVQLEGSVTVIAQEPNGESSTLADALHVELPAPQVESVVPAEGSSAGGETVIIRGARFLEGVEVFFGDAPSPSVERVLDGETELAAVTPPGQGTVPVRVVNRQPTDLPAAELLSFTYRGASFLRGDANSDGSLDISDSVRILADLFLGSEEIACMAAADANASGHVDLSDAVRVLVFLFQSTEALLPPPYPDCGDAATPLSCEDTGSCPGGVSAG